MKYFFVIAWLLSYHPTNAQFPSLQFRHVGIAEGLSQGSVYFMHRDSRGFLWLGTQDGLNRYDGKRFKIYLSGATGQSCDIKGIAEDALGDLWIGTQQGLYHYDRRRDTCFSVSEVKLKGLVFVFGTSQKQILLLHQTGLYSFSPKDIRAKQLTEKLSFEDTFFNNFLVESPTRQLWMLHPEAGLISYDLQTHQLAYYFSNHPQNRFGTPTQFSCLRFDHRGNLWLGSEKGLVKWDISNLKSKVYREQQDFVQNNIVDVAEDKNGFLWVATEGLGIWVFDAVKEQFIKHLHNQPNNPNSLHFDEIATLYIDRNNDVFANTDPQGIDIISSVPTAFMFYDYRLPSPYGLSHTSVRGIGEDTQGNIWVGTELGGLNVINPQNNEIKFLTTADGLANNTIRYVATDRQGKMWIGTLNGLSVYIAQERRFRTVPLSQNNETYEIFSLQPLNEKEMFVGTSKKQFIVNTRTFQVKEVTEPSLTVGTGVHYDARQNCLYVADRYHGIYVFHYQNGELGNPQILLHQLRVISFYQPPNSPFIWLGTTSGLVKWNTQTHRIERHYRMADGLHHEFIYSSLPDSQGQLWLSTNRGLEIFNISKETFEVVGAIPPREYNSRAAYRSTQGDLYFGSTTGLDRIRPNSSRLRPDPVGVSLTSLSINDHETFRMGNIDELPELRLSHDQNTLTFEFSAIDFKSNGQNKFRYFLQNFDTDTVEVNGTPILARYPNLASGEYVLHVQASDRYGNWLSSTRHLPIYIKPPFWQTWWFQALVIIAVGLSVWTLIHLYLNRKLEIERMEAANTLRLEQERARITEALNDNFGSQLFALKLTGQVAINRQNLPETQADLERMIAISQELLQQISEAIWKKKPEPNTLENLWLYLQKYALLLLRPPQIPYSFEAPKVIPNESMLHAQRQIIVVFFRQLFAELAQHETQSVVVQLENKTTINVLINTPNANALLALINGCEQGVLREVMTPSDDRILVRVHL